MKEIFALCGSTGVQNKVFFRRSLLIAVVFCFCIFPAVAQILPVVTVRFNNPRYACDNQTYRVDAEFRSDKPGLRLYSMNVRFCHETTALDYLGLGELAPGYTRYSPNPAQEEFWEGTPFGFPGTSAVTYINGAIQLADYTEDPILLPTGNGEWVKLFSIFFKVMDPGIIANGFCPVLIWDLQEVNSNGGFKIGSDGVTITCLDPPLYYIDGEPIYEQSKPVTEMAVQFNWIYDNDGNPATYGYPVPSVCIYGDTNPPVVSESDGSSKVECPDDIVEPEYPFASDNCSEQLTPVLESIIDTPDPLSCEGTRVYTYKYTGSTGLTAYWKYTYHILRTTPPRESGGPALTAAAVQCQDDALTPQLPEIRDVCGTILKAPEPVVTHSGGEYGGTITYDYVYIDCAGLEYPWRFTYTVMDDQPPTASNPADIVLTGCNSTFPAPDPLVVTDEADNCGVPVVAWVSDGPPVTEGCTETVIRTYSVTDGCNNQIRVTQKLIRMVDTQAPTASNPADIVLTGCNSTFPVPDPLVVTDEADNCGVPVVAWVSDGPPVTEGCTETVIRTYSVTDGCNNQIRVTQKLIRMVDTQAPTASNPADIVLTGCNSTFPVPDPLVVTDEADNCGVPVVAWVSDGPPVTEGCTETVIRTYSVTDGCNNQIRVTQKLIRMVDTQAPTASNPADIVLTGCNSTFPAPDPLVVTDEADNCSVPVVAWVSDGPPVTEGCTETVIRTYSVTDGCNNQIRVTQKLIRMEDTQAPTASNPADIVLTGCNSTFPAPDPLVVTDEADNCGVPVVAWVSDGPPVTEGCTETIIRTYSVTDGCNNLIRVTQKLIRIVDGEDPVIPCPADVVLWVSAGETSTTWTPVIPEAFDNCTASATLTVTGVRSDGKPLIDPWPLGTTTITWNTEDGCGNSAVSCFQKVTVTVGEGCLTLVAKVFLEGALIDPVTSTEYATVMRTTLNDLQMLPGQAYDNGGTIIQTPAGQPYNTAPWFYDGQEGMFFDAGGTAGDAGYPAEVVDWVLVSLRNTAGAGYQKICEKAALLLSDGTIRMVEGFDCCDLDMNGSYYLVVEHRNHLPVMSHEPVQVAGAILTYDFTRQQSYVEAGSAMAGQKEYGGYFFMYGGNGNQYTTSFSDTDINADDKTTWELNNGLTGYRKGDYNMNGDTNSNDEILWQRNNGRGTSVIRDY
jgi:hypothetical protein